MIKGLIEYIVKQLVSLPDQVKISVLSRDGTDIFEITVDQKDRGRLIGKEGQTIKSLRAFVSTIAPEDKKIFIEVIR